MSKQKERYLKTNKDPISTTLFLKPFLTFQIHYQLNFNKCISIDDAIEHMYDT